MDKKEKKELNIQIKKNKFAVVKTKQTILIGLSIFNTTVCPCDIYTFRITVTVCKELTNKESGAPDKD